MFRLQTPNTDFDGNEKLIVVQSMMAWSTYVQPLTPSFGCCPKVLQRFSLKPASRNTWSPASPPRSSNYYKSEQDLQLTCSHIMGYNGRDWSPDFWHQEVPRVRHSKSRFLDVVVFPTCCCGWMCGNCWRWPCSVQSFAPGGGPGGYSRSAPVGSSTGIPCSWGSAPGRLVETGGKAKSGRSAETEGEKVNKTKMKRWHRMKSQKIKERKNKKNKQDLSGGREENKERSKPKQFRVTGMKRVTGGWCFACCHSNSDVQGKTFKTCYIRDWNVVNKYLKTKQNPMRKKTYVCS